MSSNPSTSVGIGGPCGACKFLRRKCVAGCLFAPYFDSDQGAARFAAVHKVFGASNVSKLLLHVPVDKRLDAVVTICYEAQARIRDPVYGCVAHLFALQQQVASLQAELSYLQAHLATLEAPAPPPPSQLQAPTSGFSIANLPITSCFPTNYDLSVLFDPMTQSSMCPIQPLARQVDPIELNSARLMGTPPRHGGSDVGDLREVARELVQRQGTRSSEDVTSPSHS